MSLTPTWTLRYAPWPTLASIPRIERIRAEGARRGITVSYFELAPGIGGTDLTLSATGPGAVLTILGLCTWIEEHEEGHPWVIEPEEDDEPVGVDPVWDPVQIEADLQLLGKVEPELVKIADWWANQLPTLARVEVDQSLSSPSTILDHSWTVVLYDACDQLITTHRLHSRVVAPHQAVAAINALIRVHKRRQALNMEAAP